MIEDSGLKLDENQPIQDIKEDGEVLWSFTLFRRNTVGKNYVYYGAFKHLPIDWPLYTQLAKFYKKHEVESIIDLGCGLCDMINKLNETYYAVGVEGNDQINHPSIVLHRDATIDMGIDRQFDYVQSFEVGEHIPNEVEDGFFKNMAKLAKKGIVLSWAIEGQGGYKHINEHNNDYVIEKLKKYNFRYNA